MASSKEERLKPAIVITGDVRNPHGSGWISASDCDEFYNELLALCDKFEFEFHGTVVRQRGDE